MFGNFSEDIKILEVFFNIKVFIYVKMVLFNCTEKSQVTKALHKYCDVF